MRIPGSSHRSRSSKRIRSPGASGAAWWPGRDPAAAAAAGAAPAAGSSWTGAAGGGRGGEGRRRAEGQSIRSRTRRSQP